MQVLLPFFSLIIPVGHNWHSSVTIDSFEYVPGLHGIHSVLFSLLYVPSEHLEQFVFCGSVIEPAGQFWQKGEASSTEYVFVGHLKQDVARMEDDVPGRHS